MADEDGDGLSAAENPHLPLSAVLAGVPLPQARMVGVLAHGRDQDEQVMLDVVGRLDLPDVAYVLPVATGNTWYAGRHFDPVSDNEPQVGWALDAYDAALALARDAGVPEGRTVLAGFSQGACLSAELIARRPRRLAGVGVLTGCLLGPRGEQATPAGVEGLPVFLGSSTVDEWIEFGYVEATAQAFAGAGARVTLEAYDDPVHEVSDRAVAGLRRLFTGG